MSRASGFVRLKPRRCVNRVIQAVLINRSLFSKAVKRLFTIYIRAPGSLEDGAQEAELLWRYRFTSQTKIHLQKRSAFSFCALKMAKTNFMQPGQGCLHALARVLHKTATLAYCEGEVRNPQKALIAKALGTFKYVRKRRAEH